MAGGCGGAPRSDPAPSDRKWEIVGHTSGSIPSQPPPLPASLPPARWWWWWYLDAAGQHAGGHLLVEAGILVTVHHNIAQLGQQQQVGAVFVQRLDQHVLGAQPTHHHGVVLVD